MKKIIKIMRVFLLITAGSTFTSCLFFDDNTNGSKSESWRISKNENWTGDWYIVKSNATKYDIDSEDTGSFSTSYRRSAVTDDVAETGTENLLPKSDIDYMFHINNRKTFDEIYASLAKESKNRSASNSYLAKLIDEEYKEDDSRVFYINYYTDESKSSNQIKETATLVAQGEKCNVWFIDNAKDYVSLSDYQKTANLQSIADKFDKLYEYETEIFGTNRYTQKTQEFFIDPVEKINIVIADIADAAGGNTTNGTVAGYFYPVDCYKTGNNWTDGSPVITNGTQVLYIDSFYYKKNPEGTFSTLAHEFCHMLNYCQKYISQNSSGSIETWLTEMMAMVAEDYFSEFLGVTEEATPTVSRLPVFNYWYTIGFKEHWNDEYALKTYANAYAFGSYLVRTYCDEDLTFLKQLATNKGLGEDAVNLALQAIGMDKTFDNVFTSFPLILLNAGVESSNINVPTLYRTAGNTSNSDGMYFHKIDLNNLSIYNEFGNSEKIKPKFYGFSEAPSLGAYGFSIHTVRESISDVYYTKKSDVGIDVNGYGFTSN